MSRTDFASAAYWQQSKGSCVFVPTVQWAPHVPCLADFSARNGTTKSLLPSSWWFGARFGGVPGWEIPFRLLGNWQGRVSLESHESTGFTLYPRTASDFHRCFLRNFPRQCCWYIVSSCLSRCQNFMFFACQVSPGNPYEYVMS